MRIAICGSPHSGKTVFLKWINDYLPSEGVVIVAANPDNESLWSNNAGTFQAKIVRVSGFYSYGFMEDVDKQLESHNERIVFVDLGGKLDRRRKKDKTQELTTENAVLTKENLHILKQCDAYIILSRRMDKSSRRTGEIWRACLRNVNGRNGEPLRFLGQIESSMDPEELNDFSVSQGEFKGRLLRLSRGTRPEDRAEDVLERLSKFLLTITAEEGEERGKEEEKRKEENAQEGIFEIDGLTLTDFFIDLGIMDERRILEDPTNYNRKVSIPKRFYPLFKAFIKSQTLTDHIRIGKYMTGQAIVALCCALKNLEEETGIKRKIEVHDKKYDVYGPLIQIPEVEGLEYSNLNRTYLHTYLIESKKAVFLNVDAFGRDITVEDLEKLKMPKVPDDKVLYISGQIPYYLLASLCLSSGAKRIYAFTPGSGFTCVINPDDKEIGRITGRTTLKLEDVSHIDDKKADLWIDGINVGRFFADRSKHAIRAKAYEYVAEDERTEKQLEEIERDERLRELDEILERDAALDEVNAELYDEMYTKKTGRTRN